MKYFSLLLLLLFAGMSIMAQEDEVLPPSPKNKKSEWKPINEQSGESFGDSSTKSKSVGNGDSVPDFQPFKQRKKLDLSKFIIEPNFALSFGNGRFDVGLSPYVGYRVWAPKKAKSGSMQGLYLGAGATYFYTGLQYYDGPIYLKYNFQTYGGGVFAQYNIWKGFFARAKLELLARRVPTSYEVTFTQTGSYDVKFNYANVFTPALLVGVGYNLLQSRNFFFPIMISYNVLNSVVDKDYSLYPRGVVVQLGFVNVF